MWKLFGSGRSNSQGSSGEQGPPPPPSGEPPAYRGFGSSTERRSSSSDAGFMGFRSPRAHDQAKMEKLVSEAAQELGNGVQKIVLAAKAKQGGDEWKGELLELLGSGSNNDTKSAIDVLLANQACHAFSLRCVECELPPNLIHCMRLLRVLELQHASEVAEDQELQPIGARATAKVSRLLQALCVDPSVGEQLRPHLFGLLALSGASYPISGVHVAQAAGAIIASLAENCLTRQLVWFIHDRKMMVHMTDDIKELIGMTPEDGTSPPVPRGLSPADAEQAGLWAIALETVVQLLVASCRFQTIDLVKDFESANGYAVMDYAIKHSKSRHGAKIVELLSTLAGCPTEMPEEIDTKLATNVRVFEMQEELLANSNPVLRAYQQSHDGEPDFDRAETLPELAALALQIGVNARTKEAPMESGYGFDVSSALLSGALQLFSDHPDNYEALEERQHILTYYILALPCFGDEDLKNFALKTLEFVLTGVGVAEQVTPINACVEVFFALCRTLIDPETTLDLLTDKRETAIKLLAADLDLMGTTLEKLLQFDQRVAPLLAESGILTKSLNSLLDQVNAHVESSGRESKSPPKSTPLDDTFCIVCRVLKLLVAHQPVNVSRDKARSTVADSNEATNLHTLLRIAIRDLGNEAAHGAASVFEAYLASFASLARLEQDMRFTFQLLRDIKPLDGSDVAGYVFASVIERQAELLSMIRSVLEARSLARDAFRTCGGFDATLQVVLTLEGAATKPEVSTESMMALLQTVIALVDAAIGAKSRNAAASSDTAPLLIRADITVDPTSTQLSLGSPSALNRNFIRRRGYYVDLAVAIAGTGLRGTDYAKSVIDLSLGHVAPGLQIHGQKHDIQDIRNPDAVRLVLGLAAFMCSSEESGIALSLSAVDAVLGLCEGIDASTALGELASCGLCFSLTNPKEFGPLLFAREHHLRSRLVQLLGRLASFSMSYMDFVSLVRCLLGPLLIADGKDGRIRLPVISSSLALKRSGAGAITSLDLSGHHDSEDFCERLDFVCDIARNGDRYARTLLGGDSINTIAVLMHKVKPEERLRRTSEEGRLRFLEIESIDASALSPVEAVSNPTTPTNSSNAPIAEKLWAPLASSGFTYSLWIRHHLDSAEAANGNLYVLDISSTPTVVPTNPNPGPAFLSVWYDVQNQRFNVLSSASYRGEPTSFPVSPLLPGVWHHILLTYTPSKRSMMSRKSAFSMYVNGRALEADVRVETVSLPPNSRVIIGAPNPALAASGIVRGKLPVWELGPTVMMSTVLLDLDATAIYAHGPGFYGLFWGDRPQRTSLAATGTCAFSMLAECGEVGSIASALKRRDVQKLEAAGYCVIGHIEDERDNLSSLGLLCSIPPECVVFAFQAGVTAHKLRNEIARRNRNLQSERLVNLARLTLANETVSTDAVVYGRSTMVAPLSFADSLQWAGGPLLLMPLVYSAKTPRALAAALEIIRQGSLRHAPNLEMMQSGGGYRILAVLLKEKGIADVRCLDECLAFAVDGFTPTPRTGASDEIETTKRTSVLDAEESDWILADVDAMKNLLLNHQVWDLSRCGPHIPLRMLSALNILVSQKSVHKAFNARRLHLVGIVRWALHLMIEGAELYSSGEKVMRQRRADGDNGGQDPKPTWYCESPLVSDVSVGGDPGNPFLFECKTLLRRVLTFMLTPGDLESLADAIVYTLGISAFESKVLSRDVEGAAEQQGSDERMLPGPTARLYLVRLLEELIVDGVNEIVSAMPQSPMRRDPSGNKDVATSSTIQYHAGGVASPNQPYFSTASTRGKMDDGSTHPKHQQAQAFLSAFGGFLTPAWFATVLEGCREEASASAVLRLLILIHQSSSSFETAFRTAGGFAPLVMSIPKFSVCPGITLSMLSELLNVPILHLHSFPTLEPEQLCEVFDAEGNEFAVTVQDASDPASGIFALIAECLGRNIKRISDESDDSDKARATNSAVIELICHRHEVSPSFRKFCCTPAFLEPLSQALCLVYQERVAAVLPRGRRRSTLSDAPRDMTPTERFVGAIGDIDSGGIAMVRLLRMIVASAIMSGPRAALVFYTMFRAFPIHATAQQVEAFHLVLIEQIQSVAKEILENGDSGSLANLLGVCSVLLDQQIGAFLTAEASLEAARLSLSILTVLTDVETDAARGLSNAEHSLLTMEAAHLASLMSIAVLRLSLPAGNRDRGDEDLQAEIMELIDLNIESLLLVPKQDRKSGKKIPTGAAVRPSQSTRTFSVWQSSSLARCLTQRYTVYPDLCESENAQVAVMAPLLVAINRLLQGSREDVRSLSISVLVALLQHRQSVLSELLVAEVTVGGQTETVDVVNRGGFRALLAAHEAATLNDRNSMSFSSVKKKYASFFEWYDRNYDQVQIVFDSVQATSKKLFPGLERVEMSNEDAIEREQQLMLMRLTAQTSDTTILGGIERGELARRCAERTTESHTRWKRQGFDDLAFGATRWKGLLRQLKGSSSIWEGGPRYDSQVSFSFDQYFSELKERSGVTRDMSLYAESLELVKRWKLDLSEGHERQRRRLLPNYEFHGIYNLDEVAEQPEGDDDFDAEAEDITSAAAEFLVAPDMEATADLLKDLNLKRVHRQYEEDEEYFDDTEVDDGLTVATSTTLGSTTDGVSVATQEEVDNPDVGSTANENGGPGGEETKDAAEENDDTSSYGLITGLLQAGDWPEKSYNVRRCTGLEVTKALLLWCHEAIYIIDGFEQIGGAGTDGRIVRVEREQASFNISLLPRDFKASDEKTPEEIASSIGDKGGPATSRLRKQASRTQSIQASSSNAVLYQHRSQRIAFSELFSVYRRRYQLQQSALEFYDVNKVGTLVAFSSHKEREEILSKVLQAQLPNSIFSSSYGTFISYSKFMTSLKQKIVSQWVSGKMTNFEFIMHLNSFAGRSFNDLTQYPVFPWVIADYESEEIDLNDPRTYRDLSKPMGAIGETRAKQFQERYEALASTCFSDDDPPPFHYGTHYSCAAYVLYYLMRLEPFSRLALALQGGRFDVADRLFHDVGRSWKSASAENLQDVRELIPEFFYLPDFLTNTNHFDFGETQRGKTVHDVTLPKWAKGDPQRFVRINRQALESDYVSKNLHHWVDLIFGYKQRGQEAVDALNVFVHVTYEGEVDIDAMDDPVQRASTIAQIQNFGQTPSRLERKPFPQRQVTRALKERAIDFGAVLSLAPTTPPLCVVGAPHRVSVRASTTDVCKLGLAGQTDTSVGDMCLARGQLIGVGRMCSLILPSKKYYRFGGLNNGVSVHAATISARHREANKVLSFHDGLHRAPITSAKASLNGDWVVTGCADSTLRVWRYDGSTLELCATLCGHDGSHIKCIDVSTEFGVIASGCGAGKVLLWDLRTLTFVRQLRVMQQGSAAVSVSINQANGNILALVGSEMSLFDINGNLLAQTEQDDSDKATCAVATDCQEWMVNGIAAVTGHLSGEVRFWSVEHETKRLIQRAILEENSHSCAITALRVATSQENAENRPNTVLRGTGIERQDTLLVGDASGKMSVCKTAQLDSLSPTELAQVVSELEAATK